MNHGVLRPFGSAEHGARRLLDFSRSRGAWRTACRLGPPVLWRRRTFDRRIERCAPAVPQHDRARTSAIPLPAHRPCAAASQQSPAAIVPHGDVGCLVGFRQEGSAPSTPYMRCLIKGEDIFASFAQKVHNRARSPVHGATIGMATSPTFLLTTRLASPIPRSPSLVAPHGP